MPIRFVLEGAGGAWVSSSVAQLYASSSSETGGVGVCGGGKAGALGLDTVFGIAVELAAARWETSFFSIAC
jgi:hypothetical protein